MLSFRVHAAAISRSGCADLQQCCPDLSLPINVLVILAAGPNAFSAGTNSGGDPGMLYQPIFSTNLGFATGLVNGLTCRCGCGAAAHWQQLQLSYSVHLANHERFIWQMIQQ